AVELDAVCDIDLLLGRHLNREAACDVPVVRPGVGLSRQVGRICQRVERVVEIGAGDIVLRAPAAGGGEEPDPVLPDRATQRCAEVGDVFALGGARGDTACDDVGGEIAVLQFVIGICAGEQAPELVPSLFRPHVRLDASGGGLCRHPACLEHHFLGRQLV